MKFRGELGYEKYYFQILQIHGSMGTFNSSFLTVNPSSPRNFSFPGASVISNVWTDRIIKYIISICYSKYLYLIIYRYRLSFTRKVNIQSRQGLVSLDDSKTRIVPDQGCTLVVESGCSERSAGRQMKRRSASLAWRSRVGTYTCITHVQLAAKSKYTRLSLNIIHLWFNRLNTYK